jgi:anti-sigma-K factor RskA
VSGSFSNNALLQVWAQADERLSLAGWGGRQTRRGGGGNNWGVNNFWRRLSVCCAFVCGATLSELLRPANLDAVTGRCHVQLCMSTRC